MTGEPVAGRVSRARIVWASVIVLLTLLAYIPAINAGYIWDDDSYVTENPLLTDFDGLARIWLPRQTPQYYPMVFTSFWIEYQLWGLDPTGYHVVNVLLHACSAILLWIVLARLGVPAAWLIAAVFALHPVHVESVAWITERKNVLSLMFYLIAAIAYLRFDALRLSHRPMVRAATPSPWGWYGLAMIMFLSALLSKSVTCSLPAALILIMLWQRSPITLRRIVPLLPMFVIGFVLAMNTASIEQDHVGAVGADFDHSLLERTLIASRALLFYPQKLLWPSELMFIYPRWEVDASNALHYLPLLICIAVATACIVAFRRGWRGPFVAMAFYAGTVFPAIGFFNVYPHLFSFVADHFVYHASIGILALVIGGAAYLITRPALLRIAAALVLPTLLVLTWLQSTIYTNAETLWRDTIAKNPTAWMPRNNLASLLLTQAEQAQLAGRADLAMALAEESRTHAEAAIAVRPENHTSHSNRSEALRLLGESEQALASIETAIAIAPHVADYHWQKGRLEHRLNRTDAAIASMQQAVTLAPQQIDFRLDLARLLTQRGELAAAAAEQFAAVISLEADNVIALGSLASIRQEQERFEAAHDLYVRALDAATAIEDQVQIVTRLIRLLVTCPDPAIRDHAQAIALAEQLVGLSQRQDPGALAMLASVYHDTGDRERAVAVAREALAAARRHGMAELAAQIEAQLQQYQQQP